MIKESIAQLINGNDLSSVEMTDAMEQIMIGKTTDAQISSFLTALSIKGETVEEITAAAKVMREKAFSIPVKSNHDLIDIVGTGGDMLNTFNISTAAAFVVSGAGLKVAKHGNRSASSMCGSADVIEELGININISPENVAECIEEIGIGFLFARNLHQAMKYAAGPRKEIGIKTVFNILGPLTNPADADIQLLGVYSANLCEKLANVLKNLGRKRALVVHGCDGLDEISLCEDTLVYDLKDNNITKYRISPEEFGFKLANIKDLKGGNPEMNAQIILDLLKGKKSSHRDIVVLNAAAAIFASRKTDNLGDALKIASESIDSRKALSKLNELAELSRSMK
jgi:anthranilate phosphoribosyltransferase